MDESNLFLKKIEERFDRFLSSYMISGGDFLSPEEQSSASGFFRRNASQGAFLYGGYDEAERRMPVFMPDYTGVSDEDSLIEYFRTYPDECPIRVLEISIPAVEKTAPGHRDYLGSLMGLGIKREKVGDIIVGPRGAQILVSEDMAEYLKDSLSSVGRVTVTTAITDITGLTPAEVKKEEREYNVSSPRLDNVVSAVFSLSRKTATEAITKGLVFVDGIQVMKPDRQMKDGEKLVLRGKGKAIYEGVSGTSRKGKDYIRVIKYI
jgi:RNA-binding protein YlmH